MSSISKMLLAGSAALALLLSLLIAPAAAISVGGPSDCDSNAVIKCGAHSTAALMSAYKSSSYAQAVFTHFGVSNSDMTNLASTEVVGSVSKSGNVFINGKTDPVATGAVTGGRQDMPGSTKMTTGGVTFFERPTSVSFQQNSLPAFVSMQNNKFQFAILASCGNAVMAKPVTPTPAPARPAPTPTPTPAPAPAPTQTQSQSQSQEVVVQTPAPVAAAPAPTPAPMPTPAPAPAAPRTLPSTGPTETAAVFTITSLAGMLGYRRWLISRHTT